MTVPTLQYLVAFNNNPTDDPALITTVASPPGTLGAANVWTDISQWVLSDNHQRGRQQELQQFEAGTLTLPLRNDQNQFTPWNTSSPYAGLLVPKKPIQVRATWSGTTYTRWTGHVSGWQIEWPDETNQTVTLKADDAFRFLNMANVTSTGYAKLVLADGASGYWRLGDPVGSTTVADSGPNGYTGNTSTPGQPANATTVTFGNAALMVADPTTSAVIGTTSGPTVGYLSFPGSGISTGASFTVNLWVKYIGSNSGTNVFVNVSDGTTNAIIRFSPSVHAYNNNTAEGATATGLVATLTDGHPHMLTVVFAPLAIPVFYLDGQSVSASGSSTGSSTGNPTITNIADSGDFDWQDFSVFPSALSSAQISALYAQATIPQQSTDARIARVLDIVGWSSGARALDAGASTVQAVTASLTSTSSLAHMQQVEATEAGAVFMTGDGKVKFLSRQTLFSNSLYTASQATLGDNTAGGDIPFLPGAAPARDDLFTFNEAVATRAGGNTQRTTDATSITTNGRTTWQPPATLLGTSDTEVLELTQYVVSKFKTPQDRLQSITIDLYSLANDLPAVIPTLLSLDLLYRVTVERTHMPGGGTAFTQTANIEHLQETITPNQWLVTFALAIADPAWWVLGTAQLGTSTRLAF